MKVLIIICAALFLLHQIGQKLMGLHIPLADAYLDPLLSMPLLLYGLEWERKWLWGRPKLSAGKTLWLTAILAVLFKWIFPYLHLGFTFDWIDIALYFIGAVIYLLVRQ